MLSRRLFLLSTVFLAASAQALSLPQGWTVNPIQVSEELNEFCSLSAETPLIDVPNQQAMTQQQQQELRQLNEQLLLASGLATILTEYRESLKLEDACKDYFGASTHELGFVQQFKDDSLLSLVYSYAYYTGGAHGNATTYTANVDLNSGKLLLLSELLKPAAKPVLIAHVKQGLQAEDRYFEEWVTPWEEEVGQLDTIAAYSLNSKGVVLHFDAYVLGPYAAGPFDVTIPWTQLKRHVKADSPAARFLR